MGRRVMNWRLGFFAILFIFFNYAQAAPACDFEGAIGAYIFHQDTWEEERRPLTFADRIWLSEIGEFTIQYRIDQPDYFDVPDDLVYISVTLFMLDGSSRYLWIGKNDGPDAYVWASNSLDYNSNYHLRDTCAQQIIDKNAIVW
jgi:hypothetical protein